MGSAGLILAAGMGTRLGLGPKAFLEIGGVTLLEQSIKLLRGAVDRLVVGVPGGHVERAEEVIAGEAEVCAGGSSRHETIVKLFNICPEALLVIHDVACPFASRNLLRSVISAAETHGAACPFYCPSLPVAIIGDNLVKGYIPRFSAGLAQTPQAFHREILERAISFAALKNVHTLVPWELIVECGVPVHGVPGEEGNYKITTPADWKRAAAQPSFL